MKTVPFMKYVKNRELRKELYMAYNTQCTHNDGLNNLDIVRKIVNCRLQIAQLLGFPTYADYVLKKRMAENKENVFGCSNGHERCCIDGIHHHAPNGLS